MSFDSKVYRVLIATPSDVEEEREIIAKAIQSWNDLNSFVKKTVLLPLRWETHVAPEYNERPQEVINRAIVDDCDLLIGCFWTRIGSPTGKDESGTLEEIKRVTESGKPVMLYFSKKAQDPSLIDLAQLGRLREFKDETKKKGLIEEYSSSIDFRDKLARQLEIKIREIEQKSKRHKDSAKVSFVSIETRELQPKVVEYKISRSSYDMEKLGDFLSADKKYSPHKASLLREVESLARQQSTVPIVLGIENQSTYNLNNFLLETKISGISDKVQISSENNRGRNVLAGGRLGAGLVPPEIQRKLINLDNDGVLKKDGDLHTFSFSDLSIQRGKTKVVRPYLFLTAKESTEIKFESKFFCENILEPIVFENMVRFVVDVIECDFMDLLPSFDESISDEDDIQF